MSYQIPSPDELLKKNWDFFSSKIKVLIISNLLVAIPWLIIFLISGVLIGLVSIIVPDQVMKILLVGVLGIISFIALVLVAGWTTAAPLLAVKQLLDDKFVGYRKLFSEAKPLAIPMVLLSIGTALSVFGGMVLLILPGVILSILFGFAYQILIEEKVGGFSAMSRSVYYIKKSIFSYISHVIILTMISFVISGSTTLVGNIFESFKMPFIGVGISLVVSFLSNLFVFTYIFLLYKEFKKAYPVSEEVNFGKSRSVFMLLSVLGLVALVGFSILFANILSNKDSLPMNLDMDKYGEMMEDEMTNPEEDQMIQEVNNDGVMIMGEDGSMGGMMDTMEAGMEMDPEMMEDAAAL